MTDTIDTPPMNQRPAWLGDLTNPSEPATQAVPPDVTAPARPATQTIPDDAKIPDRMEIKGPAKGSDPRAQKQVSDPEADAQDDEGRPMPRKAADWKAMREANKSRKAQYEAKIAELEKAKAELEEKTKQSQPIDPNYAPDWKDKLTAAEKRAMEYEDRLKLVAVEKHPQFEAYYKGHTDKQIELASKMVPVEKSERVKTLLAMPQSDYRDRQLSEFVEELAPLEQSRFGAVLNTLDALAAEKAGEIAKYRERFEQLTKSERDKALKAETENTNRIKSLLESTRSKLADNPVFKKRDGDSEWNKSVDARLADADALIHGKVTPERGIEAAHHAAAYPALMAQYQALETDSKAKIAQLEKQISDLTSASPRADSGRSATTNGETKKAAIRPGMNPIEITKDWTKNMMAEWQRP